MEQNITLVSEITKRPTRACRQNTNYALLIDSESEMELFSDQENSENRETKHKNKKIKSNNTKTKKEINSTDFERVFIHSLKQEDENGNVSDESDAVSENPQSEIETNIVIAHSQNNEPDKISIDIFSKDPKGTKANETKVSIDLNKEDDNLQIENFPVPQNTINNVEAIKSEVPTSDLPQMEPGSLMIMSSIAPSGGRIFKVYMVTENKESIPLDLSPDIVQSLTTSLGSAEEVTLDLPVISNESWYDLPNVLFLKMGYLVLWRLFLSGYDQRKENISKYCDDNISVLQNRRM